MRLIGWLVCLAVCLIATTHRACGQVASQYLGFTIVGEYQFNFYSTNAAEEMTNQSTRIRGVYIASSNIVKSIALDLYGKAWTNWENAALVRETDLTTGDEAIFLRQGREETNVSPFFGTGFSNDFRAGLANNFTFTNTLFYSNGVESEITNMAYRVGLTTVSTKPIVTNVIRSASLFSVSLNTSNLKFNLLMFGTTTGTNLVGSLKGTNYDRWVDIIYANGVGDFAINLGTNIFFNTNLYETTNFVSGPARATFSCYGTGIFGLPDY